MSYDAAFLSGRLLVTDEGHSPRIKRRGVSPAPERTRSRRLASRQQRTRSGAPARLALALFTIVMGGLGGLHLRQQIIGSSMFVELADVTFPIAESTLSGRVVALPDMHGDYNSSLGALALAGVVSPDWQKWTAGASVVIQLGDIVDRGPDSIRLTRKMIELQEQARRANGRLDLLIGNHELLYLTGDFSYANEDEIIRIGDGDRAAGLERYRRIFSPTGELGRSFLARPVAVVAGQGKCRSVFVHGGISPAYLKTKTVDEINQEALRDITETVIAHNHTDTDGVFSKRAPVRFRDYAYLSRAQICPDVDYVLSRLGAERMIVGHTVQKNGARIRCGGKLVLIDVGMSRSLGGRQVAWVCENNQSSLFERTRITGDTA